MSVDNESLERDFQKIGEFIMTPPSSKGPQMVLNFDKNKETVKSNF